MWMSRSIVLAASICATLPAGADDIAFSLVHRQGRIDIPASAVTSIEARTTITLVVTETQERRDYEDPHVELCYTADIQAQICRLTGQVVEQPMNLVIDCESVAEPVVHEPICGPCLHIFAGDLLEAKMLAQRLKKGSNRLCAPLSRGIGPRMPRSGQRDGPGQPPRLSLRSERATCVLTSATRFRVFPSRL